MKGWPPRPRPVMQDPQTLPINVGGIIIKVIRPLKSTTTILVNPHTKKVALKDAYDFSMPSEDMWVAVFPGMVIDLTGDVVAVNEPKAAPEILVY